MKPRTFWPLGVTKKEEFFQNLANHVSPKYREACSEFFAHIPENLEFEVLLWLGDNVLTHSPVEAGDSSELEEEEELDESSSSWSSSSEEEEEEVDSLVVEVGSEREPPFGLEGGGEEVEKVAEEAAMARFMEVTELEMKMEMMGYPDSYPPPSPSRFGDMSLSDDDSLPDTVVHSEDSFEGPNSFDRYLKEWTKCSQV